MFDLTIDTGNAAFGEDNLERDAEIARILRQLAERLESDPCENLIPLFDLNGNRVGEAIFDYKQGA